MVDPWTHWSDDKSSEDKWVGDEDGWGGDGYRSVPAGSGCAGVPGSARSSRVVERFGGMRSCLSALTCRRRQDRAETGRRSWGAGVVDPAVLRISVGSEKRAGGRDQLGDVSFRQDPAHARAQGCAAADESARMYLRAKIGEKSRDFEDALREASGTDIGRDQLVQILRGSIR